MGGNMDGGLHINKNHVVIFDIKEERALQINKLLNDEQIPNRTFSDRKTAFTHLKMSSWNDKSVSVLAMQCSDETQKLIRLWELSSYHYRIKYDLYDFADNHITCEISNKTLKEFTDEIVKVYKDIQKMEKHD
jgi:patatin-like phospholipase/acyl hydrolase